MSIREHPRLYLVKPSIGQPIILLQGQLNEGFTVTFAGKSDWIPTSNEFLQWIKNDSLWLKKGELGHYALVVKQVSQPIALPSPKNDPPLSAVEYQYLAGFRWEFDIQIEAKPHIPPRDWPQMLDIWFRQKYWDPDSEKWLQIESLNNHAVYIDERFPQDIDRFSLLHVTDLHVSRRNDRIPEILAEVRTPEECRDLLRRYYNFNDNFRTVIAYANEQQRSGKLVVLAVTGDLVDYYHDGYFAWDNKKALCSTSNFTKLIEIITGKDGKGEALECPIFMMLGNHDFLQHEVPLSYKGKFGPFTLRERDTFDAYNLFENEGREYDYYWKGYPSYPYGVPVDRHLWSNNPEFERRKYIKEHDSWQVNLDKDQFYSLGWPHYCHIPCFIEHINYNTDFVFNIGPHQFVCLNTGPDIYPSQGEFIGTELNLGSDAAKDYVKDGPHNLGITDYHLDILKKVLENFAQNGLVLCFTHAPVLSLHKDRTEGMEILFEQRHAEADPPPNDVTVWLGTYMSIGWAGIGQPAIQYFEQRGYPQAGTAYFKKGNRDSILNFSCSEGKIQEFFELISPIPSNPGRRKKLTVLLSGHTHKVHEFRLEGPKTSSDSNFYFFMDDYSGTSIVRARDKTAWIQAHAPLLLTSGGQKRNGAEFRELVLNGNMIQSMQMITLQETRVWFESILGPNRFIRGPVTAAETLATTAPPQTYQEVCANTFRVVPGLADNHQFSFESVTTPGFYLCRAGADPNSNAVVVRKLDSAESNKIATFKIVPALTGEPYPNISIESDACPGEYLVDSGPSSWLAHLVLTHPCQPSSTKESKRAASFRMCLEHGQSIIASRGINWQHIGDTPDVTALASVDGKIYAATKDNKLWTRNPVASESAWSHIGHANEVVAMTAHNGKLFAVTKDSKLWVREPVPRNVNWLHIGHSPDNVVGLAATDGRLFAACKDNKLWVRKPVLVDSSWYEIGHANSVVALTDLNCRLLAATSDKKLWLRHPFPIEISWKPVANHDYGVVGLAFVDGMLFVATHPNRLWVNNIIWMQDLGGSRPVPNVSIAVMSKGKTGPGELGSITFRATCNNFTGPVTCKWKVSPQPSSTQVRESETLFIVSLLPIGTYSVTVTVTDSFGEKASATKRTTIQSWEGHQ